MNWKFQLLKSMYGKWPPASALGDGYSIMLLIPSDMPFLLRIALDGLASIDTSNCREILVIRDPFSEPKPDVIDQLCRERRDPRLRVVTMSRKDSLVAKHLAHAVHWLQVVNGIRATRYRFAFLHDADAFFCQPDALERQYVQCRNQGLYALGVQARSDVFFGSQGMQIPGTWELMFDVAWAKRYMPLLHRGLEIDTPHGKHVFDNTLYPQYLEYKTGKVGIMNPAPEFAHFNGTIFQYRRYRNFPNGFEDEYCRILLLSILERCLNSESSAPCTTPEVALLARGLLDPKSTVTYLSEATALRYHHEVRPTLERVLNTALFSAAQRERAWSMLQPFDERLLSHPAVLARKLPPVPDIDDLLRGSSKPQRRQNSVSVYSSSNERRSIAR